MGLFQREILYHPKPADNNTMNIKIDRWNKLSLIEQMANIGAEFQRAVSAKKAGNIERTNQATERMLELLDLTIANQKGRKFNELTRLREIICDDNSSVMLQNYFLSFALAARK